MAKKVDLALVNSGATTVMPPRKLGKHGRSLWDAVMVEYGITDRGGIEILAQACEQLDEIESLAEEVNRDGRVIRSRNGPPKAHPAIRDIRQGRAVFAKLLKELGLNLESVKPMGRPPQGVGWLGPEGEG
jgi:P27 family predicted phage terminase small subunit